jgi:hypothetical protein
MDLKTIEQDFREKVSDKVRISSEGVDRFRVFTPFMLEDGDHLSIVLKRDSGAWILSDEGHTYLHLAYILDGNDLQGETRDKLISNALSVSKVEDREGELIETVEDDQFGEALSIFVQALHKITELFMLEIRSKAKRTTSIGGHRP